MQATRNDIEKLIDDAQSTVEHIRNAGRSVPEWALTEVTLARNVLEAHDRGDDPSHALGVLQTFQDGNKEEKDAFFSDPAL
ncbi:hypothetical protein [Pseudomonas matsuisoli]|uniref:Uncharacterized protein n=1 Tax=Pseudomonas matsuisoli TaxID=1515666 RepID=A0A917US24_9PSED|nr:hypothetical protein [Pseudomonas matsuisoli]GGJ80826.1 hypothetical protein GCM10009304_03230 [Pseudomonas matsuisoli]